VLVAALSTGHKVGLGLVGAAFVVFALISAFLIPRLRPDYPARRGLPVFLTLSVALFAGMMFGVFFFGRESEEGRAEGGSSEPRPASTTAPAETTAPSTTAPTTTQAETHAASVPTTAPTAPKSVPVTETEFKIALASESFSPGSYKFELKNDGQAEHDLVINGPGVNNEKTPLIGGGKTATLTVELKSGTYDLYCSVPGHKQAGMDVKIKVS
jgi:plastocyanin